ncbi:MAG: hypothetical protein ACI8PG_004850 [Planctomycetota bacterium]|jgi:hypothetical protein
MSLLLIVARGPKTLDVSRRRPALLYTLSQPI